MLVPRCLRLGADDVSGCLPGRQSPARTDGSSQARGGSSGSVPWGRLLLTWSSRPRICARWRPIAGCGAPCSSRSRGCSRATTRDETDADPRTIVLVARTPEREVLGGVRLGPATAGVDLGWWHGGRLVVRRGSGLCCSVPTWFAAPPLTPWPRGRLRFEADVQSRNELFFARLGWHAVPSITPRLPDHVRMRLPIERIAALVAATKAPFGELLGGIAPGGSGFVGDDGAPVPGSDLIAACDAILPAMVERDPEWAGWCSVLVNVNDLAAMGAAAGRPARCARRARTRAHAAEVLAGSAGGRGALRRADSRRPHARSACLPSLGGHRPGSHRSPDPRWRRPARPRGRV